MPDAISAYFIARFLLPPLRYSPWLPKFATQGVVLKNHFPNEY